MLADDVETSGACGWTLAIRPLAWLARSALQKIATLFVVVDHDHYGRSRDKLCNEKMVSSETEIEAETRLAMKRWHLQVCAIVFYSLILPTFD